MGVFFGKSFERQKSEWGMLMSQHQGEKRVSDSLNLPLAMIP